MGSKKINNLIVRLRDGDEDAFEEIYWLYRNEIYGLAFRYLKDHALSEDAVQDIFIKLWLYRNQLDSGRAIHGFLFTSLKNHVLNMIKSRKRRILRQFEYIRYNDSRGENPEDSMFHSEYENIVREGLKKLPAGKQLVFKLKFYDGFSSKEIASELGISVNTAKSQFYKANKFIQTFIKKNTNL
jgi:RNA polymerase sigma-70 factor (family 1)